MLSKFHKWSKKQLSWKQRNSKMLKNKHAVYFVVFGGVTFKENLHYARGFFPTTFTGLGNCALEMCSVKRKKKSTFVTPDMMDFKCTITGKSLLACIRFRSVNMYTQQCEQVEHVLSPLMMTRSSWITCYIVSLQYCLWVCLWVGVCIWKRGWCLNLCT